MGRWGYFVGDVDSRMIPSNKRDVELLSGFSYVDKQGIVWKAPKGLIVNGASVPWFFWRICPPYVGNYRRASVVHDAACCSRRKPSKQVHLMFYEAMRCDKTNAILAWIMWLSVRLFGPRWENDKV